MLARGDPGPNRSRRPTASTEKPVDSYWELLLPEKPNGTHWCASTHSAGSLGPGLSRQIRGAGSNAGLNCIPDESARAMETTSLIGPASAAPFAAKPPFGPRIGARTQSG